MINMSSLILTKRVISSWFMIKKNDLLGEGKLQPLWVGPYVVTKVLSKGAYEL